MNKKIIVVFFLLMILSSLSSVVGYFVYTSSETVTTTTPSPSPSTASSLLSYIQTTTSKPSTVSTTTNTTTTPIVSTSACKVGWHDGATSSFDCDTNVSCNTVKKGFANSWGCDNNGKTFYFTIDSDLSKNGCTSGWTDGKSKAYDCLSNTSCLKAKSKISNSWGCDNDGKTLYYTIS